MYKTILKNSCVFFTAFLISLSLFGCKKESHSVLDTIKERGVMKVGLGIFVPWAMKDKQGELVGFEIDVAKSIAEELGVEIEFIPTAWDGIIPALLAKKFDIIISGMSITKERKKKLNFSDPYASSGFGIYAHKKKAKGFNSLDDFNNSEVKIAVRRGATPAILGKELFPKAELLLFDEESQVEQEVLNGNVHASLASEPQPSHMVYKNPDVLFKPVNEVLQEWFEGLAVRKDDERVLEFLNDWIVQNKENGWLKKRHNYWFATLDWADAVGFK